MYCRNLGADWPAGTRPDVPKDHAPPVSPGDATVITPRAGVPNTQNAGGSLPSFYDGKPSKEYPCGFKLREYLESLPQAEGRLFAYGNGETPQNVAGLIKAKVFWSKVSASVAVGVMALSGWGAGTALSFGMPLNAFWIAIFGGVLTGGGTLVNCYFKDSIKQDFVSGYDDLVKLSKSKIPPVNKAHIAAHLVDLIQQVPLFLGREAIDLSGSTAANRRDTLVGELCNGLKNVRQMVYQQNASVAQGVGGANMEIAAVQENIEEAYSNKTGDELRDRLAENICKTTEFMYVVSAASAVVSGGMIARVYSLFGF